MDADIGVKIIYLLISVLAVIIALSVHEFSHGYAAYKLGDHTAKSMGRLSLNPMAHLDPIGTLMLLLVGFGWARPVPINTRYFQKPRRDIAITSIAGPASNFIVAFAAMFFYALTTFIAVNVITVTASNVTTFNIILTMFYYIASLNLGLGLFNLIPLPPLDGSNVLMSLLPPAAAQKYSQIRYYSQYIFIALIVMSRVGINVYSPLNTAREYLLGLFSSLWGSLFGLFA